MSLGVAYKQEGRTNQVMEVYQTLRRLDPAQADKFFNAVVLL